MTDKQIYQKAAELIDSGKEDYSCWAILTALGLDDIYCYKENHPPALRRYIQTFNGRRQFEQFACRVADAVCEFGVGWSQLKKDQSNFRVLMLLFMAEACEDL